MAHPYLVVAQTSEEGDTEPIGDGADEIESVDINYRPGIPWPEPKGRSLVTYSLSPASEITGSTSM
jgi:hypothetical protein